MSLASVENASRAQERDWLLGGGATEPGRAHHDDFFAAHAAAHTAMAICERLIDNPADPDAQAAARQLIDDNPDWVREAQLLVASLPD